MNTPTVETFPSRIHRESLGPSAAPDDRLDIHGCKRRGRPVDYARVEPGDALVQLRERLAQLGLGSRLERALQVDANLQGVGEEREVLVAELALHPPHRIVRLVEVGKGLSRARQVVEDAFLL